MLKLKLLFQNLVKALCDSTVSTVYPQYQLAKVCPFQDLYKGRNHNAMKLLGARLLAVKKHHCYTEETSPRCKEQGNSTRDWNDWTTVLVQTRSDSFSTHIEQDAECKNDKHIVPLGFGCEGPRGSCWIPPQSCGGTAIICRNNRVDLRLLQSNIIILSL